MREAGGGARDQGAGWRAGEGRGRGPGSWGPRVGSGKGPCKANKR